MIRLAILLVSAIPAVSAALLLFVRAPILARAAVLAVGRAKQGLRPVSSSNVVAKPNRWLVWVVVRFTRIDRVTGLLVVDRASGTVRYVPLASTFTFLGIAMLCVLPDVPLLIRLIGVPLLVALGWVLDHTNGRRAFAEVGWEGGEDPSGGEDPEDPEDPSAG